MLDIYFIPTSSYLNRMCKNNFYINYKCKNKKVENKRNDWLNMKT